MHELSICTSIVETVTKSVEAYPGATVTKVSLRLGALSDIVEDSLRFCWELTTKDTPLEAAELVVATVPVVMRCDHCQADVTLASLQSFRCPRCHEPVNELLHGREMEIDSIEIDDGRDEPGTAKTDPEEKGK